MEVKLEWLGGIDGSSMEKFNNFCDNELPNDKKGGVYFWVFKGKPERIIYIGQTYDFFERFYAHLRDIVLKKYTLLDCATSEECFERMQELDKEPKQKAATQENWEKWFGKLRFVFAYIEPNDKETRCFAESELIQRTMDTYGLKYANSFCSKTSSKGKITFNLKGKPDEFILRELNLQDK